MKKTYPINDQYRAVIQTDENTLTLWIEKIKFIFFGIIDWSSQFGYAKWFILGDGKDGSPITECYQYPLIRTIEHPTYRNIDNFDLEVEIAKLYNSVMNEAKENNYKKKKREYMMNKIINIS